MENPETHHIQSLKTKINKRLFFNLLAIAFLFILLISISFKNSLPATLKISNPVKFASIILYVVGAIGAIYLWFVVVIKNIELIHFKEILKLVIIFLVYTVFHLFLWATYNINNSAFRLNLSFFVNKSLSPSYLIFLAIIFIFTVLTLISKKVIGKTKLKEMFSFIPDLSLNKEKLYSFFLVTLAFLDSFTLRFIWNINFGPTNTTDPFQLVHNVPNATVFAKLDFLRWIGNNFLVFLVVIMLSVFIVRGLKLFIKNKTGFSLAFTSSLILAFIFNYFIQIGMFEKGIPQEGPYQGYLVAGATFFQVLILTGIFLIIYLLINRYIIATGLILIIFGTFTIANHIKFQSRLEPIYISDLSWIKNPATLLSFVNLGILLVTGVVAVVLIVSMVLLSRSFFKGKLVPWKARISSAIISLAIFAILIQIFANFTDWNAQIKTPFVTNYIKLSNSDVLWRGAPYVADTKSLSYVWLRQSFGTVMSKPAGYSKAKVEEVTKEYSQLATTINKTRTTTINHQTVIYILSESLANPNRVSGVTMSANPLPNIDKVIKSSTGGLMFSNGYGGGTANMEAQSLSGLPMMNYSNNVTIINSDVIPHMPFIPSISNFFNDKDKIALHPEDAANYNRNIVYKKLGFDNFYALTNTTPKDTLKKQKMLDGKVSDAQTYKDILSKINPKQSQFFSVMTMQNHMPFNEYSGKSTITASGKGYSSEDNHLLQNYARKINTTDGTTQKFLDQLKKIKKKITVVFYGDHLPSLYPNTSVTFQDNPFKQYETDYFIWTNHGNAKNEQVNVNSSEFTPKLLETDNAKVSPYYALLSQVMWTLPPQYDSVIGATVKLNAQQTKTLNDLKIIQYDLTAGKHYLSKNDPFFKIGK